MNFLKKTHLFMTAARISVDPTSFYGPIKGEIADPLTYCEC